jgi:hypothetical protein
MWKPWLKEEKFGHISGNIKRTLVEGLRKDQMLRFCREVTVQTELYESKTWVMKETTKRDFKQVKSDFLEISKDMEE